MKFSIIVPVYNSAKYVSRTIDNLLDQRVDKEIILVNDGSQDDSLDLLRQYEKNNECIIVVDKKNGGVSSARNAGINVSTGELVLFVDSDDLLAPDTLKQVEDVYNENVDCVFYSYKTVKDGKDLQIYSYLQTGLYSIKEWINDFDRLNKTRILNCIGAKVYRNQIIKENNIYFNENISYCEDVGFCTSYLLYTSSVYYINEPLYYYMLVNENSLMTKYKPYFYRSKDYLHELQYQLLSKNNIINAFYKVVCFDVYSCVCNEMSSDLSKDCVIGNLEKIRSSKYVEEALSRERFTVSVQSVVNKALLKCWFLFIYRFLTIKMHIR